MARAVTNNPKKQYLKWNYNAPAGAKNGKPKSYFHRAHEYVLKSCKTYTIERLGIAKPKVEVVQYRKLPSGNSWWFEVRSSGKNIDDVYMSFNSGCQAKFDTKGKLSVIWDF